MSARRWFFASWLLLVWANMIVAQTPKEEPKTTIDLKPYEEFSEQIAQSIVKKEPKKLAEAIDTEILFDRALKGVELSTDVKKSVIAGGKKSLESFPQLLIQAIAQGGSYKLLRVRVVDGEVRALFRMLADTSGVNYHDMLLKPNKDRGVTIGDIYVVVSGEFMSQTVKRTMFDTLAIDAKKLNEGDIPPAVLDAATRLRSLSELVKTQKYSELLKEWEKLPDAMKKDKGIFMFRFVAATALMEKDPEGYEKVMEDYQKLFPDDPTSDLILIDSWFLKKKFKQYHESINRLDKAVGGDPYLHVLRAIGYREEKKYAEAKTAGETAQKAEPELTAAYDILMLISIETKKFDDTVKWLSEIEKRFKAPIDEGLSAPEYAEFLKSPEYGKWKEDRKKK